MLAPCTPPPTANVSCGQDTCWVVVCPEVRLCWPLLRWIKTTGRGRPSCPLAPAGPAGPAGPVAPAVPAGPRAPRGSCPDLKSAFSNEPLITWRLPTLFGGSSFVAPACDALAERKERRHVGDQVATQMSCYRSHHRLAPLFLK